MKNKTNILFITWGLYIGGSEAVVRDLCKNINRENYDVTVCYLESGGPIANELSNEGFKVRHIKELGRFKNKYLVFANLIRFIKRNSIDIVHTHGTGPLFEMSIAKVFINNILHVHTFHYGNYPNVERKKYIMEKMAWRFPDRLVAVGHSQKASLCKTYSIPDDRVTVIWNGVDVTCNDVVDLENKDSKIVIGSVSTLTTQKGIDNLIKSAKIICEKYPNVIFHIVGDGVLMNELQALVKCLGLEEKVEFFGWMENAAETAMPCFDIFVQSSHWEAMSIVLIEAMFLGKPIVATDVGDNSRMIAKQNTGIIVNRNSIEELANAIGSLVSSEKLREVMGNNARKRANMVFTGKCMGRNYEDLYTVLGDKLNG